MNIMEHKGYKAKIEYDADIDMFRGEILGINGSADFYGKNPNELRKEFATSLKVFLDMCEEDGVEPHKAYSGKFNLRIPPHLHERIAIAANANGESINQFVEKQLEASV